jgi:hypothetical protein
LAGVVPASGRLRGEEAAGCGDPASNTEPAATTRCRTHRTLCSSQTGKCQHGNLQLSARDHFYRFKNRAHQASLQENERGKMKAGLGTGGQIPFLLEVYPRCRSNAFTSKKLSFAILFTSASDSTSFFLASRRIETRRVISSIRGPDFMYSQGWLGGFVLPHLEMEKAFVR